VLPRLHKAGHDAMTELVDELLDRAEIDLVFAMSAVICRLATAPSPARERVARRLRGDDQFTGAASRLQSLSV
jgi:hypothetical protein